MIADREILKLFLQELSRVSSSWSELVNTLATGTPEKRSAIIKQLFLDAHNLKAGAQVCEIAEFTQFIHAAEDLFVALRDGRATLDEAAINLLFKIENTTCEYLACFERGQSTHPSGPQIIQTISTLLSGPADVPAASVHSAQAPAAEAVPIPSVPHEARPAQQKSLLGETINVDSARLDDLLRLVGEISVEFQILKHFSMKGQSLEAIEKGILELKDVCLELRLQPVLSSFKRWEKTARDTARDLKKKLRIVKTGEDVLLDKSIIDQLIDPLLHVVRNAVDHGIEKSAERILAGKPDEAVLEFHAEDLGGKVVLEFKDDGRGVDPEFIFRKAVEKKLVAAGAVLTDEQKVDLMFLSGFSTAEKVSHVSGRGIGLDIVRSTIKSLGGRLEVQSRVGEGTTFRCFIPTQMSLIEALVVSVGNQRFAVPKQDLKEVIDIHDYTVQATRPGEVGLRYEGHTIPVKSLSSWFSSTSREQNTEGVKARTALIVQQGLDTMAFLVDEVFAIQQVFVRPLPSHLSSLQAVSGTTVFSDGEPGMILNLSLLVRSGGAAA